METRRNILAKIGLGAVSGFFAGMGLQIVNTPSEQPSSAEAPWWLLGDLKKGSYLGRDWFLSSISPIERGASIITMQKNNSIYYLLLLLRELPRGPSGPLGASRSSSK